MLKEDKMENTEMLSGVYSTYEEKSRFVENVDYDGTVAGLLSKLRKLKENGYVFRGQSDALWPIVSSAQREYVSYLNTEYLCGRQKSVKGYLCYLEELLRFVKSEPDVLPKFRRRVKGRKSHYDHEIWGWLQHYSYVTPFIDFSNDQYVALFMAARNLAAKSVRPMMFSVYALRGECVAGENELLCLETWIKQQRNVLAKAGLDEKGMYGYDTWEKAKFVAVHKSSKLNPWDNSLGKDRIASQKGMFVYMGMHDISLERYLARQDVMNHDGEGEGCILEKIKCFDIPVSFAPFVLECCRKHRCTAKSLGLEDQKIDNCLKSMVSRFRERMV